MFFTNLNEMLGEEKVKEFYILCDAELSKDLLFAGFSPVSMYEGKFIFYNIGKLKSFLAERGEKNDQNS